MARTRYIKPGFFTNEDLAALEPLERLLFAGLWTIADKEGRLEDRPLRIKAEVLPYDNADVDAMLSRLDNGYDPFIRRYQVDGRKYIQIVKWHENQSPHHTEKDSVIPEIPEGYEAPLDNGYLTSSTLTKVLRYQGTKGGARGRFEKPPLEQVAAYCAERGGKVDPSLWFDHYESNGWKVGKNPMRDWRAAVRKWEHGGFENRAGPPQKPPEVRQVTLVVFNAHAAGHDFKDGPYKKEIGEHKKVWGTLKNGRKIESYTDPTWQPKN